MSSPAYGAFQPIVDLAEDAEDKVKKVVDSPPLRAFRPKPTPAPKKDTSWHDSMVDQATKSFTQPAKKDDEEERPGKRMMKAPAKSGN